MDNRSSSSKPVFFDHAADIGFEVTALTKIGLFEAAAEALFTLMVDPADVDGKDSIPVRITGAVDTSDLLVRFLSEFLFLHDARDRVFSEVKVTGITGTGIEAEARGENFDPGRHTVERLVKAVTYHDLSVMKQGEKWSARVVVDI